MLQQLMPRWTLLMQAQMRSRMGIGPGSICTDKDSCRRRSAAAYCDQELLLVAKNTVISLIADGGIKYSGDIAKALAAGPTLL